MGKRLAKKWKPCHICVRGRGGVALRLGSGLQPTTPGVWCLKVRVCPSWLVSPTGTVRRADIVSGYSVEKKRRASQGMCAAISVGLGQGRLTVIQPIMLSGSAWP